MNAVAATLDWTTVLAVGMPAFFGFLGIYVKQRRTHKLVQAVDHAVNSVPAWVPTVAEDARSAVAEQKVTAEELAEIRSTLSRIETALEPPARR